ncbi:3BHS7 dehydrogenase, partial [Origma solitaria]|nr:3BHS7 dehydrogenase [Origma solitaria]
SQGLVLAVTGGSGFFGSHLVQLLLEREPELRELRVLDLRPEPELIPERHRDDGRGLAAILGGASVVFHCASLVDVWGRSSAEAIARANVLGTKNVIRACRAGAVPVLIYTSSMEVVGPNTRGDPFVRGDEDSPYPTRHSEPYPLSKAQAERLVLDANGKSVNVAWMHLLVLKSLNFPPNPTPKHPIFSKKWSNFHQKSSNFHQKSPFLCQNPPNFPDFSPNFPGNVAWMHLLAARAALSRPDSVAGDFFFCYDSSPRVPYEDFNLLLLGPAGIRSGGPRIPPGVLGGVAKLGGALRGVLGGGAAPLLNPYTWAVACT